MYPSIEQINRMMKNTLMETLDIQFTSIGTDFLVATMPVNSKVHQPMGFLHGGASVALAESVGSTASFLMMPTQEFDVKGIEISAHHIKSKKEGMVTATARLVHKGKTTHLWEIKIVDENEQLISICHLTNMIIPKTRIV